MGEKTGIAWTDSTFNYWIGCEAISPGCLHCYAHTWATNQGRDFAVRTLVSEHGRNEPLRWERNHEKFFAQHGRNRRVFCSSLADVFDNDVPDAWRAGIFDLMRRTPHLHWQVLTKRIGNAKRMLPADWGDGYPNVWIGSTMVTQEEFDRDLEKLLAVPARWRFISFEPLLEEIKLPTNGMVPMAGIDWAIIGGESGKNARPFDIDWGRNMLTDLQDASIRVFWKQLGSNATDRGQPIDYTGKGDDESQWAPWMRVQEFPASR